MLGVPTTTVEIDAAAVAVHDITIRGVLNGPGQFSAALAAIASGEVRPELLIDRIYPFDDDRSGVGALEGARPRQTQGARSPWSVGMTSTLMPPRRRLTGRRRMGDHYFDRVRESTGARFWVNNPTIEEVELALRHGAMGCTTNPAYGGNLVKRAPDEVLPIVRECLPQSDDGEVIADLVQRRLVARICERFLPLYELTAGREGFVSIQGLADQPTRSRSHPR